MKLVSSFVHCYVALCVLVHCLHIHKFTFSVISDQISKEIRGRSLLPDLKPSPLW
jgi:hypothetical protein